MNPPADAWLLTFKSGNKSASIGSRQPDDHEIIAMKEPMFLGRSPITGDMRHRVEAAYVEGFTSGKRDPTFRPTNATLHKLAKVRSEAYWRQHCDMPKAEVDYVAAAEHLAFTIHGVKLAELSDKEQADCHRWARSTINAALKLE